MPSSELKYKHWMITIMSNKEATLRLPNEDDMRMVLNELGKDWVFQKEAHEKSENENYHYQVCLVTNIRTRKSTLLGNLSAALDHPQVRIRVEKIKGTWEQAILYCSKQDTRVDNPIYSASIQEKYDYKDISFLQDESRRFPWQKKIIDLLFEKAPNNLKDPDDRTIIWITDTKGNSGKSKLVKYFCSYNDSISKLSFGSANQLRSSVAAMGPKKLYILDIPRTLGSDDSINDLLSVIEDIKNGFITSSFYGAYNKLVMNPPAVLVLSNRPCPVDKLSSDRWLHFYIFEKDLFNLDEGYPINLENKINLTNEIL